MPPSNPVDPHPLEQYYSAHHSWVHAWLKRRLGDTHDAADLAHDVFVRLLVKPRQFDSDNHARAYLHSISRHVCIDFWRRRELERAWQAVLASRPEAWAPSEEHQAIIVETLQQVYAMLARLPEKVARCFVLVQVQGMNYREAAQRLGVTERSVTSYMAKAMFHCLLLEAELDQALI